ncbi:MAG: hypothetical protein ACTSUP_07920 [Candidatus Heimdallarchaeaceae archaeon]
MIVNVLIFIIIVMFTGLLGLPIWIKLSEYSSNLWCCNTLGIHVPPKDQHWEDSKEAGLGRFLLVLVHDVTKK